MFYWWLIEIKNVVKYITYITKAIFLKIKSCIQFTIVNLIFYLFSNAVFSHDMETCDEKNLDNIENQSNQRVISNEMKKKRSIKEDEIDSFKQDEFKSPMPELESVDEILLSPEEEKVLDQQNKEKFKTEPRKPKIKRPTSDE